MPGLRYTTFELKMMQDGFIDKNGKIIKGALAECDLYLVDRGVNKNGDLVLTVGPASDILVGEKSTKVVIPKEKIQTYLMTKNFTEFLVLHTMVESIIRPMTTYITATAADTAQKIYARENKATKGALIQGTPTLQERREYAIKCWRADRTGVPADVFDAFKNAPKEFLASEGIITQISNQLFTSLNKSAEHFGTPEEIVSLRATATKTVTRLMNIASRKGLSDKDLDKGLRKFDESFEGKQGGKA